MHVIQNLFHFESASWSLLYLSVDHQKPVVCSSCLDNDGKASLSQALLALGGKLVNSWSQECTHLAMPSVKVTIKVRTRLCIFIGHIIFVSLCWRALVFSNQTISALLCCRPVVKPEFFSELNKAVQQKLPPPKAERYNTIHLNEYTSATLNPTWSLSVLFVVSSFTPDIDEPSLTKEDVNLGVMPVRKQLFTKKTFIFLSAKQVCFFLSF